MIRVLQTNCPASDVFSLIHFSFLNQHGRPIGVRGMHVFLLQVAIFGQKSKSNIWAKSLDFQASNGENNSGKTT